MTTVGHGSGAEAPATSRRSAMPGVALVALAVALALALGYFVAEGLSEDPTSTQATAFESSPSHDIVQAQIDAALRGRALADAWGVDYLAWRFGAPLTTWSGDADDAWGHGYAVWRFGAQPMAPSDAGDDTPGAESAP